MLEKHLDEGKWAEATFKAVFLVLVIKARFFFLYSKQLSKTVVVGKMQFCHLNGT